MCSGCGVERKQTKLAEGRLPFAGYKFEISIDGAPPRTFKVGEVGKIAARSMWWCEACTADGRAPTFEEWTGEAFK